MLPVRQPSATPWRCLPTARGTGAFDGTQVECRCKEDKVARETPAFGADTMKRGKNHSMNKSRTADANRTREHEIKGRRHQEQGHRDLPGRRLVSQVGLVSLVRLAPLVACAGVLTAAVPAKAQEPAAPAPAATPPAAPAPAEATPAAAAAPPEASPEAAASGAPEAGADAAAEDVSADSVIDEDLPEVVVTGFQRSLSAALEKKQRSTGQIEAIVADDIADFPDLNLAESLQRMPGIAIQRSNGEGATITVRGLSGLYTRVRINGMEARANIGNSTQQNGARGFDFNLFASELFNSIVVHKTASADLEEGSLGAVVDLNTARAFNYKEGFTFVAGATGSYNDLSNTVRPRLTGLVAYRDPGGLWGATASIAYTRVRLETVSTDTVNWQKATFRSIDGNACTIPAMNGMPAMASGDPGCAVAADAFHPRIPRFAQDILTGDRIGATGGVQFRPTEKTEVRLDGLYAAYPTVDNQRRLFPLLRGNEGQVDLTAPVYLQFPERFGTGNNSLIAADVDNAWIRSEHQQVTARAKFYQVSLGLDHRFSDDFYINALGGMSRSKSGLPHDTTVNYDNRAYNDYRFDFTNDESPILAFNGPSVNDPATFNVPELRDRVGTIKGGFDTAELNLHYDIIDQLKLAAGVNYKRATYDTVQYNRDGTVCALGLYDAAICDPEGDGTSVAGVGPAGDPALSEQVNYPGGAGPGSTTRWVSPSIEGWVNRLGYYDAPLTLTEGGTNKVTEKNLGFYLQTKGEVPVGVGAMRLLYDAGVRYVQTRQTSGGYQQGSFVTVERPMYDDWLPSANAAFWFTDELALRLAAARVLARPALGDLSPGAGVDSFGYSITFQNPNLDPIRATVLDAAIEWYFANDSLLSLAGFWKDIASFPISESQRGTFASTGLPHSVIQPLSPADVSGPDAEGTCGDPAGCWSISRRTNGPGAKVKGFELAFQAPFKSFYDGLPIVLKDMGFIANYTYVDSSANYVYFGNPVKERLQGLSNNQYNATLYYDDSKFNARVSVAYRSDFLGEGPNSQGNLWAYTEADTRMDFSTGYNINEHFKLSFEGLNVINTPVSGRVDVDAERRAVYNKFGRTFLLGARMTY